VVLLLHREQAAKSDRRLRPSSATSGGRDAQLDSCAEQGLSRCPSRLRDGSKYSTKVVDVLARLALSACSRRSNRALGAQQVEA
jgi:hypothetical protein